MRRVLNVRLDEKDLEGIEERDRAHYPSQSDYVREALRRMHLEERRNRVRLEAKRLAENPEEMALMREIASARVGGLVEQWERADRGET